MWYFNDEDVLTKGVAGDIATGTTFYTIVKNKGLSNEVRMLFKDRPNDTQAEEENLSDIFEYTNGKNYHKFPVQDNKETSSVIARNRVLRNHLYEFSISTISDLGDWYDEVNPEQPIPEKNTVITVSAKVGPWDKVEPAAINVR
jgi:hypothetical protein